MTRAHPIATALLAALAVLPLAVPAADGPEAAFEAYIRQTNSHDFDNVAPLVDDQAIYWFRQDDHRGLDAVRGSFDATWAVVSDEVYSVHDVQWLTRGDEGAAVVYGYCWQGLVDGHPRSGGGRGTNVLRRADGRWKIVHEHLSAYSPDEAARCRPQAAG